VSSVRAAAASRRAAVMGQSGHHKTMVRTMGGVTVLPSPTPLHYSFFMVEHMFEEVNSVAASRPMRLWRGE
jgi:hypothetical protein